MNKNDELAVGLAGLGSIGMAVAQALDAGIPGLHLCAVSARDATKTQQRLALLRAAPRVVDLPELATYADVVVECVPAAVYDEVAQPAVEAGCILVTLSSGALLVRPQLVARAKQTGARIIVPSGGILGLDALKAAAEGEIHSVTLTTRKPPGSLAGAPYLVERDISVQNLTAPKLVFRGNARAAATAFPANANVAATLSLAGIGAERTEVEIWADPDAQRNMQHVRVRSASADFEIQLATHPLAENPRTGSLTPKSVIATLRALTSHFTVGTL
jgi:aspartate dehydrogenase